MMLLDLEQPERLRRELRRWQTLIALGEVEEEDYRRETVPLRRRLAQMERPPEVLEVQKAAGYRHVLSVLI